MKHKIIALLTAWVTVFAVCAGQASAAAVSRGVAPETASSDAPQASTAAPSRAAVLVDGEAAALDAYNIDGSNYFKLRDLASVLTGGKKQFDVQWNGATQSISLLPGQPYTAVGGELQPGDGLPQAAKPSQSAISLDGTPLRLTAYNIGGNTYFKLRDLALALDFAVGWDEDANTVSIETALGQYEYEVFVLVNRERAAMGVAPLALRPDLCDGARLKSQDMGSNNYCEHISPTYGSPFDMMQTLGVSVPHHAGENIAMGQQTPELVMRDWMNSPGHRASILSEQYTAIGIGYEPDGRYWTQWFVG